MGRIIDAGRCLSGLVWFAIRLVRCASGRRNESHCNGIAPKWRLVFRCNGSEHSRPSGKRAIQRGVYLLALSCAVAGQAQFTEFYANSTGTNINSGHTTNATPKFEFTNGSWDDGNGIFTAAGADLTVITNGDFAAVYVDGATQAALIGRIIDVDDGTDTIQINTNNNFSGISPSFSVTGRSIRVGGAWFGPLKSGAVDISFPFPFVNALLTNTAQGSPRYNIKNDRMYVVTNLTIPSNGPFRFEGFASVPGDNGITKFSGATPGAGFTMVSITGGNMMFGNFLLESNGASGTTDIMNVGGVENYIWRVSCRGSRRFGFNITQENFLEECEAATNNASAGTGVGGFAIGGSGLAVLRRCISHHNAGLVTSGFIVSFDAILINCIGAFNGRDGALVQGAANAALIECDFYGNGSNGVNFSATSAASVMIENCNFLMNTNGYGINSSGSPLRNGFAFNCGFGAGTKANGVGTILPGIFGFQEVGSLTYTANTTPWVDPDNGNFTMSAGAQSINSGRGSFFQVASSFTNTVGYPDIGAAAATNAASSGGIDRIILRR